MPNQVTHTRRLLSGLPAHIDIYSQPERFGDWSYAVCNMPAQPKTTDAQIIRAALLLFERQGRDGFSMRDLAAAVGIRAPSLYGRFKDRASLLAVMELQLWADLANFLGKAIAPDDPEATLIKQAKTIRRFAKKHPNSYSLFFDIRSTPTKEGNAARAKAVAQMMEPLAVLVGKDQAFAAARVLTPYLHGFITMELANGFRLSGGVDEAFENGVLAILRGLTRTRHA
jgi:AcrR family transcriptional regulator